MSTQLTSEARESELVGKVEMRIALAEDDQLSGILKTYLAPLLLKLGSEHVAVRNKVISTCQHIKVRLQNKYVVRPRAIVQEDSPLSLDKYSQKAIEQTVVTILITRWICFLRKNLLRDIPEPLLRLR